MDEHIFRALYDGAGDLAFAMRALSALGSGWVALAILPFFFWPPARRPAIALAAVVLAQSWVVFALKRIVGRTRPWIALSLSPRGELPHDFSFPSGHATASFTVAAFLSALALASAMRGRHIFSAAVLFLAALIAVSRVVLGAHWPLDVGVGAMLGSVMGSVAARFASVGAPHSPRL